METISDLSLNFNYKIDLLDITFKLLTSLFLGLFSSYSFSKFGFSINRSNNLVSNSIILAIIVTLIISVVKSSLALSLGLVGALSVVRFRNAIKDPLELLNYFSAIAIGLSIGADQYLAAIVFCVIMFLFNYGYSKFIKRNISDQTTILLLRSDKKIEIDYIILELNIILSKEYKLISLTNNSDINEACFELYDLKDDELMSLTNNLKNVSIEIVPSIY
jgi:hypothetical protein